VRLNKKDALFLLFMFLLSTISLSTPVNCELIYEDEPTTTIIYTSSSDSTVHAWGTDNYTEVWIAVNGNVLSNNAEAFTVGQQKTYLPMIYIYRSYLYFETSIIPDEALIVSANLTLKVHTILTGEGNFTLTIQNGQPTYPHDPTVKGDYNKDHYSGIGGEWNTTNAVDEEWFDIILNEEGLNWINLLSTTKFCLRSSRDINATEPTHNEFVQFYTNEGGNPAKLTLTYYEVKEEKETSSGGDTGNGEPTTIIDIPEITVPKIPVWGYYLILGSVCVVALASLFTRPKRSRGSPKLKRIRDVILRETRKVNSQNEVAVQNQIFLLCYCHNARSRIENAHSSFSQDHAFLALFHY